MSQEDQSSKRFVPLFKFDGFFFSVFGCKTGRLSVAMTTTSFLRFAAFVVVPTELWECVTTFGATQTGGVVLGSNPTCSARALQGINCINWIYVKPPVKCLFIMWAQCQLNHNLVFGKKKKKKHLQVCAFLVLSEQPHCIEKLFWRLLMEVIEASTQVDPVLYVSCKKLFCCGSTFWWSKDVNGAVA